MAEITSVAVLITTAAAAIVAVIAQAQHSRCVTIKLCCGLFQCSRKVPDVEENTTEDTPPLQTIPD
jgi:hypothetical protein